MNLLKKSKILIYSIFVYFICIQNGFAQFEIPEKPSFQTSVYDYANLLNSNEKSQLEEKLIRYSDSTSTQMVVITIESLKGEDIGILTPKWAHQWGLGTAKEDNGVLILLSKVEKKIWISVGYGLEDRLTAAIGGQIIRNTIVPEFKLGSFYNGLNKGADEIFKVFKGKYKGSRIEKKNTKISGWVIILVIFIIIILIIRNKGGKNSIGGSPSLLDVIILSSLGRNIGGFGGGGSSSGGGFGGGFGGGGFSGGGSGGSW